MTDAARDATCNAWIPRREPSRRTRLLGILNVTPDSFSDAGQSFLPADAVRRAHSLIAAGADALDLGAESTRPGAAPVSLDDELRRLLPVLEQLEGCEVPLSIDTTKARVARRALEAGASIVNDVSAFLADPAMAEVCASAGCGVVLMHRRGTPETMRGLARYHDVVSEVVEELESSLARAIRAGVRETNVFLDPGIGFAKTAEQSFEILRRLPELFALGRPLVLGVSRKSFLARTGGAEIDERLSGTLAAGVLAVHAGVEVLRVHDVGEHVRAVRTAEAILERPVSSEARAR